MCFVCWEVTQIKWQHQRMCGEWRVGLLAQSSLHWMMTLWLKQCGILMKMFRYLIKFGIHPAGTCDIIVIKSFIYTQTLADLVKTRAQNNLLNCFEHEPKQRGVRRLLGDWWTGLFIYRGGIVLFACSSRLSRGHLVLTSRPVFRFLRTGPGWTFQMKLSIELADIWTKM